MLVRFKRDTRKAGRGIPRVGHILYMTSYGRSGEVWRHFQARKLWGPLPPPPIIRSVQGIKLEHIQCTRKMPRVLSGDSRVANILPFIFNIASFYAFILSLGNHSGRNALISHCYAYESNKTTPKVHAQHWDYSIPTWEMA